MASVIWFDQDLQIPIMAYVNFLLLFGKEDEWNDITNKK